MNEVDGIFGGIGLLTIIFILLRICGVIKWSLFWVLSPVFIPLILVLLFEIVDYIVNKSIKRNGSNENSEKLSIVFIKKK
jgi:hypothetical protein